MASPQNNPIITLPPSSAEITYSELIQKLTCTCAAGSYIKSSPVPSATIDMGDVIATQMAILAGFTAGYSIVIVAIRMISCVIDVLCALMNPFSLIFAIIRLFGTCLPDFILIFPQIAIPAKIICIIKILLAVFDYILNVILPVITDIINNINTLKEAIENKNEDAKLAICFKIASLFKELLNIIGILTVFMPVWDMVRLLLSSGASLPCGGGGGSCSDCGDDDNCPEAIQVTNHNGNDGEFIVNKGKDIFNYELFFYSENKKIDFLSIKDFFPVGLNYSELDEDYYPYSITVDGKIYAVTSINNDGKLKLFEPLNNFVNDGYLSNIGVDYIGLPISGDPDIKNVRFASPTGNFTTEIINKYITINDGEDGSKNNGTWEIYSIYNSYNIILTREDGVEWEEKSNISWKIEPYAPIPSKNKIFDFKINHNELIRHNLINLGCHPSVKFEKDALKNRFSNIANNQGPGLGMPELPDLNSFINNVTSCVTNVVPYNVDYEYIIENYEDIENKIIPMGNCIEDNINNFKNEIINLGKQIYPKLFDTEKTANYFTASPHLQLVGNNINVSLIIYDRYGDILGKGFPEKIMDIQILASSGTISTTSPILDNTGVSTGEYIATLQSDIPQTIILTAKVGDDYVSDYNKNTGSLVSKEIEVQFITTSDVQRIKSSVSGEGSSEPLRSVGGGN